MQTIDLRGIQEEPIQNHTSKGDQPKWQLDDVWYKADHMGYEALSEVVVSRLLDKTNVKEFVRYDPVQILTETGIKIGCASDNFREPDEMLIPFERLHRAYYGQGLAIRIAAMDVTEKIAYTVQFVEETTKLKGVGAYLTAILELDAFFLNEDRHTNNLAVLRNEKTQTFRLCPLFDHGLSLLSDTNDYPLNADLFRCISRIRAKPFSEDFDEQVSAAEQLYGQQLQIKCKRNHLSEAIHELVDYYPAEVLSRAEDLLFEQARKYPYFFLN